jgi:CRISPR type IV-associated protein Csf2
MLSIQGTLRLTSPLHVSAFETSWRLNDERRAIQGDSGGKPLTRIARQTLVDKDNITCEVPLVAANGFRGRLRRLAAKRVQNAIGPVSIDTYHGLACGAVSGRPAKDAVTISGMSRARDNVYLGLFGGGPALQQSRYRAFDAVPVTDATIGIGMVPDNYAAIAPVRRFGTDIRPARPDELLFFLDFNRVDDALRFRDPEAPTAIKDYNDAMANWMAKISDNKDAVAANKDAVAANKGKKGKDRTAVEKVSKSSIDAMSAIEVLAPGAHLFFRIDLDESVDDAQAGLMMLCVADLVKQNRLGGWGRNGLGTFSADLAVFEDGERLSPLLQDGNPGQIHPDLETFETAAQDAMAALDADSVAALFAEE